MSHYVQTLRCPDRPGIVKAFAEGVAAVGGNIVDNKQFSDPVTGLFLMRSEFEAPVSDLGEARERLEQALAPYEPALTLRHDDARRRMLVMVSKFDHCLVDLMYRHRKGELPVEIPLVVSNHDDLREEVESQGYDFALIPVTPETKPEAEAKLLGLVEEYGVDFVVLARYMQVLSDGLARTLSGRAINIHHSFLPGFKGAKPYHQAYERGVKIIGATAHYVTADLDEGPIIDQDVVRVGHSYTPADMVALGRDVERVVLSRAVRLHAEDRVLIAGSRTVIFD